MTSSALADRFIEALATLEKEGDAKPIAALFSPQSEIGNILVPEKFHSSQGALDFWTKYRETFDAMASHFRNRIVSDGRVALEWSTEAATAQGQQVRYEGVSILEVVDDQITRFRAYFDPAALGKQMEPTVEE